MHPEEEAPATDSNGVPIAPKKAVIKFRVKASKREAYIEEEAAASESSHEKAASSPSTSEQQSPGNICPECNKDFPSAKSLYGHLRSHPNRGYRGARPPSCKPAAEDSGDQILAWPPKAKKVRSRYDQKETEVHDTKETEAATTLKILSMGLQPPNDHIFNQIQDIKPNLMITDHTRNEVVKKCYKCNTCDRSFPTHQALGGHKASHNKHKHNLEVEASADGRKEIEQDGTILNAATTKSAASVHQCETCGKTFGSGQALGGHKREHYGKTTARVPPKVSLASAAQIETSVRRTNYVLNEFDLNEPPSSDGEEL